MSKLKDFIDKITSEKEDARLDFNSISKQDLDKFKVSFLEESDGNKILYLKQIIEKTDETELTKGNFSILFEDSLFKELLYKCVD